MPGTLSERWKHEGRERIAVSVSADVCIMLRVGQAFTTARGAVRAHDARSDSWSATDHVKTVVWEAS